MLRRAFWVMATALGIAMMSVIACSTSSAPATMTAPTATPPMFPTATTKSGCFLTGHAVPCREFRQQVFDETVADLRALDCDALVKIVGFRLEGWRTAERTGRATEDEGKSARDAIGASVRQLGCWDSAAWREYLANLR